MLNENNFDKCGSQSPTRSPSSPSSGRRPQEPREKPQEPHGSDDFSSAGAHAKQEEPQDEIGDDKM